MWLIKTYNAQLKRHPLFTQSISTAALFALGDAIAQTTVEQTPSYDLVRTSKLAFFGGFISGPSLVTWYRLMEHIITFKRPITSLLTRVALDQSVFAPTFLLVFFCSQGFLSGESPHAIRDRLRMAYSQTLLNNYRLWPAVQLLNFYFVPLQHRVLVVNTVALGWNAYLSVVNQRANVRETVAAVVEPLYRR